METGVKYPNITVKLVGEDGNSVAIISAVRRALLRNRIPQEEIDAFLKEAFSSSGTDGVLQTCMRWVEVE